MPARTGKTASKAQVVKSVRSAAKSAGKDTLNDDGEEIIGGHWARLGGARHQRRHGVSVPAIMAMARWDSHCVLRYLKDAVLHDITQVYKQGSLALTDAGAETKDKKKTNVQTPRILNSKVLKQLDDMAKEVERQEQELADLSHKLEIVDTKVSPPYIISAKYKKWHICLYWHDSAAEEWKTKCGWRYAASKYERRGVLPTSLAAEHRCGTCFGEDTDEDELAITGDTQ